MTGPRLGGGDPGAVPPFALGRTEIREGRVAAARVVEGLEVVEGRHPRLGVRPPAGPVDRLALEGGEEALGKAVDAPMVYHAAAADCAVSGAVAWKRAL